MGIRIPPKAATVAGPEPEMAPQSIPASTVAKAAPGRQPPTRPRRSRTILSAIPARSMTAPARMKKGMARRGNLAIPAWKLKETT